MNRLVDDDNIYEMYTEGKLGSAMAIGAMAATSLFGNGIDNVREFVDLWSNYYQTSNDPNKEKRAFSEIQDGIDIPRPALNSINKAASIFDGDMGVSADTIRTALILTGEVESGYRTKRQYGGGPARSYWQVEPATALDNLTTGSKLLGPKFKQTFAKELQQIGTPSQDDLSLISDILERNDDFAAAMAAMVWVRRAHGDLQ